MPASCAPGPAHSLPQPGRGSPRRRPGGSGGHTVRLIHWTTDGRRWPRHATAVALAVGGLGGILAAWHLPGGDRGLLARDVLGYAAARAQGRGAVFGPALDGWLRTAAPVWLAGMWSVLGVPLVLGALAVHAFALGFALAVAASGGGWPGLQAGVAAVLPGNILALPALWWLGTRAVDLAAARRGTRRPVPQPYLQVGLVVLLVVTGSSVGEALVAPLLLRAVG